MPSPDRNTYDIAGPAKVTFNGATFFSARDISVRVQAKTFDLEIEAVPTRDKRVHYWESRFDIVPDGRWNPNVAAALFPWLNARKGQPMFTSTDVPLQLDAADGAQLIVQSCVVTKMPRILFSQKKSLIEAVRFRALRQNTKQPTDANSLASYAATGSTFVDSSFTGFGMIPTQPYTLTFGSKTGFTAVHGIEGITLEFDMTMHDIDVEGQGVWSIHFVDVRGFLRFMPFEISAANALAAINAQGTGALGTGSRLGSVGVQVTITGDADSNTYLTAPNCTATLNTQRYGAQPLRNGEVEIEINRPDPVSGVQQALCTL
jgi:hypothetical protein